MKNIGVIFLLMLLSVAKYATSQEIYNGCSTALEVCPNNTISANNIGANVTFCAGCEDDFNFCFTTENSIWFTFTTNALGGDVSVAFSNLNFATNPGQDNELQAVIIEATTPCNSASYNQIGNCVSNGGAPFGLNAIGLTPNTTYYIVVDGDNTGAGITSPAECTFDLTISGNGVDRPVPGINLNASSNSICLNEVVFFEATLTDCPDSLDYNWYLNGELVAVTDTNVYSTSALQDGDILSVENSCYSDCIEIVTDATPPFDVYSFSVNAGLDQTVLPGTTVSINGITSAPDHNWEPAFLFSNPSLLSTFIEITETITITLTATENGCTLSDQMTIFISDELFIPNMFSPNGDDVNELWVIEGIEEYPNNSVRIYDRWGQEVFQSTGYSLKKAWDGKLRSGVVTEGVYYYIIQLNDGSEEIMKGSITVIR